MTEPTQSNFSNACTETDSLPSGSNVTSCQHPDPCGPAWARIESDVTEILRLEEYQASEEDIRWATESEASAIRSVHGLGAIMTPRKADFLEKRAAEFRFDQLLARNRRISAAYAELFLRDAESGGPSTNLLFVGGAAFGSKQVGCGMVNQWTNMPAVERLAAGNAAIYESFYPASRFYVENINRMSKEQLIRCLEQKYPPENGEQSPIVKGINQIMEGKNMEGVLTIVDHEQGEVLKKAMYGLENAAIWGFGNTFFRSQMSGAIISNQFKAVFSSECSTGNVNHIVEYPSFLEREFDWTSGLNSPVSFDNRMMFFTRVLNKFVELWSGDRSYMIGELRKIQEAGFAVRP